MRNPSGPALSPQEASFVPSLPVPLGLPVSLGAAQNCPYLPACYSVSRGFRCDNLPGWVYQALMDAGFRRSGSVFYQNACPGCRACTALRVPVARFVPSRSQRRLRHRNRDLLVRFGRPRLTAEKHGLYARYLVARHNGAMSTARDELEEFLYRSPTETIELVFRTPDGLLAGVGICDVTPSALSSVYFFFDPELGRRGLGTFSALAEIELARRLGLDWYYPGFWVPGCPKMEYKSRFRPCELLGTDGRWRPFDEAAPLVPTPAPPDLPPTFGGSAGAEVETE